MFDNNSTAFGSSESTLFGSSTSTAECRFNQDFSPTFNSANVSLDNTHPAQAFGLEQFSRPSSEFTFTTDYTSMVPNNNPSELFSVPFAPAVNASPPLSPPLDASSFLQFQPTQAQGPVYPHTGALLANASPSNASPQPTTTPLSDLPHSQLAPETSALSSVSGTSLNQADDHRSGNPVPSNASQPTTTPAPAPALPYTGALSANALPSNASPQPTTTPLSELAPETSTLSSVPGTSVSGTSSSTDSRRSGRNPVPSKRHEQMNEIDGKGNNKNTVGSAHIEKENIPSSTIPEWTIASRNYLLNSDLGKDWTMCVDAWFELEKDLGYGSQAGAKVCLLIFFSSSWTLDLNLCDRELYRSQQLVHRSGQVGHLSPALASATTSLPL